jgi:enoyl-CoA hydratase
MGWADVDALMCSLSYLYGPERFSMPTIMKSLLKGDSAFKNCSYEVDAQGIALMTVDHPPMNTLGSKTLADITANVLQAVADPKVRVILITGNGNAFIAGADIEEIKSLKTYNDGIELPHKGYLMTDAIESAEKPIIAVINGFCLGGGLELAMSCHMRIASDKARLGLPEINLGLIPGFAGTQRLGRIVGKAKALEMILTGGHYSAKDAYEMGLVNKVVPHNVLMEEAKSFARIIASKSQLAVKAAIDAVSSGLETSFEEGLVIESENLARVTISHDAKEGLDAFLNKRKPDFKDM